MPQDSDAQKARHRNTWVWVLTAAIVALATLLNIHDAAVLPYWHDEGWTLMQVSGALGERGITLPSGVVMDGAQMQALLSQPGPFHEVAGGLYAHDTHPPVYFQTAWAWAHVFGTGPLGLRSLSVACVAGAVLLTLRAGRHTGAAVMLVAALMLASPGMAYSAVNARGYGMAILLTVVALVGAIRSIESQRSVGVAIATGAAAGMAMVTHYFSILVLLPIGLTTLLFLAVKRRYTTALLMVLAATPGALWAALVWLPQQIDARPEQMQGFGTGWIESLAMVRVIVGQFSMSPLGVTWLDATLFVAAPILLCMVAWHGWRHRTNPKIAVPTAGVIGVLLCLGALFWATDKTLTHFSVPRYGVFLVPALALVLAEMVARTRHATAWSVGGAALILALGLTPRLSHPHFEHPWSDIPSFAVGRSDIAGMEPRSAVVLLNVGIGRIGVTVPTLLADTPVVYMASPDDLADWLNTQTDFDTLHMRPLPWASENHLPPFPEHYTQAAQDAGFSTEGLRWMRRTQD